MKNKLISSGIIAAIFIAAMIVYKDSMTINEIILAFLGAGGTIGWVWNWVTKNLLKEELGLAKEVIDDLVSEIENKPVKK